MGTEERRIGEKEAEERRTDELTPQKKSYEKIRILLMLTDSQLNGLNGVFNY